MAKLCDTILDMRATFSEDTGFKVMKYFIPFHNKNKEKVLQFWMSPVFTLAFD